MIPGNVDPDTKIPAHEAHLVHVITEITNFDQKTGARLSVPKQNNFYPKEFKKMEDDGNFAGMDVKIIHDPEQGERGSRVDTSNKKPVGDKAPLAPTRAELLAEYKELYKENAPDDVSDEELIEAIQSKKEEDTE